MAWYGWLAWYVIGWWLVFFIVLPVGRRPHPITGDRVPGSDPGAPERPALSVKLAVTSVLTAILVPAVFYAVRWSGITLDSLPLPSPPSLQ